MLDSTNAYIIQIVVGLQGKEIVMKKIIILPLALVSLLALTGCDSYGTFTLVEDSEAAESTFEEAKTKNEQIDDVSGYEAVMNITGTSTNEDEEEVAISTTVTQREGIDDTHYASDFLAESDYGTFSTYTRFNSTDNTYYDYMKLNFTFDDEGTTVTIDNNLYIENSSYDGTTVYDAELISKSIGIRMLESMEYSEDMKIYTSTNGYYKIEYLEDDYNNALIFNDEGLAVEVNATNGDLTMAETLNYGDVNFDTVAPEDYEVRDFEYSMSFLVYFMTYLSMSTGDIIQTI